MLAMADQVQAESRQRGRPRSEASHQAVLEATARLLCSIPYEDLTVERIAAEAGVGKQTIYRWWKNKAAVVLETLVTGQTDMELVDLPDTGDLRADLLTWTKSMISEAFAPSTISMARSLVAAGVQEDPATEELLSGAAFWDTGRLVQRLRSAEERGEIRPGADLTAVTAALGDPFILRLLVGQPPGERWAQTLVDVVVRGLQPQGASD